MAALGTRLPLASLLWIPPRAGRLPVLQQECPQHIGTVLSADLVRDDHLLHHLVRYPWQRLLVQVEEHSPWRERQGGQGGLAPPAQETLPLSCTSGRQLESELGWAGPKAEASLGGPLTAALKGKGSRGRPPEAPGSSRIGGALPTSKRDL